MKLILEDGTTYKGYSFGSIKNCSGEVVFNTGMMGYPETLTDPSYKGQILCLTYPLVGNYGIPDTTKLDKNSLHKYFESGKIQIKGLIISDYSKNHNHWNSLKSLGEWLKEEGIPAMYDIDTRSLTKRLRESGTILGKIVPSDEDDDSVELYDPNKDNLVNQVSTKQILKYGQGEKTILVIDCGCKNNIIRSLVNRSVKVIKVPWDYDIFSKELEYDGILISNGPGNPTQCKELISNIKKAIAKKIPIFGICLGNQILGIAAGAKTYKLKYGHRSQNQPCIIYENNKPSKRCYITSQNHGFAIDSNSLPEDWSEWFVNANDRTNEGIIHKSGLFYSVQFHPEANPGPIDTTFLFDKFIDDLNKNGN